MKIVNNVGNDDMLGSKKLGDNFKKIKQPQLNLETYLIKMKLRSFSTGKHSFVICISAELQISFNSICYSICTRNTETKSETEEVLFRWSRWNCEALHQSRMQISMLQKYVQPSSLKTKPRKIYTLLSRGGSEHFWWYAILQAPSQKINLLLGTDSGDLHLEHMV